MKLVLDRPIVKDLNETEIFELTLALIDDLKPRECNKLNVCHLWGKCHQSYLDEIYTDKRVEKLLRPILRKREKAKFKPFLRFR